MVNNLVGQVNARSIFDKRKAWFAAAGIAPHVHVGFEIRNRARGAIGRLLSYGLEEQFHCVYKAFGASGACVSYEAREESKRGQKKRETRAWLMGSKDMSHTISSSCLLPCRSGR
jgi:hypothetical protein